MRNDHIVHRVFHKRTASRHEYGKLLLSRDCFACRAQGYWIILSAKQDKYLCVPHSDLASIGSQLQGWRCQDFDSECAPKHGAEVDALIDSLISCKVVTSDPNAGKPFAELEYPVGEASIEALEDVASPRPSASSTVRFYMACGRVDLRLRTSSMSRTLAGIEERRRRSASPATGFDTSYASMLITTFKVLRPFYPRPSLCLFDSLALLEFAANYRLFPRIVFGVIADPFQAHCWLQEGSMVLNDDLERISRYKPILSV